MTTISLRTPQQCLAHLRALADTPINLPAGGELTCPSADAVTVLAGEHASMFAQKMGRWEWTAAELVGLFAGSTIERGPEGIPIDRC